MGCRLISQLMVYMQFFRVTDQSKIKHKLLVIQVSPMEMKQLLGQCEKCLPSIYVSSIIQIGHPYVVVDFSSGTWKTAIALDEKVHDEHMLGDELEMGDVIDVILTSEIDALMVEGEKAYLNVPLENILSFNFLYTAEIAENYALYKMIKQPKEKKPNPLT